LGGIEGGAQFVGGGPELFFQLVEEFLFVGVCHGPSWPVPESVMCPIILSFLSVSALGGNPLSCVGRIATKMSLLQRAGSALRVERWACSGCRSDILVTIRAGRAVYAALMFIGPPLAGVAAEMPLLCGVACRDKNVAPTLRC